ncbi:MAG: pilus assembly protein PilP [Betaproteobacteria bacterium]|nr:pilus assembly protein PilP [Betaproteobacteria bacterium]MDH5577031.1 pilus assembly protein PilP [Betaproteobacteria bacterium]
MNIRSFALVILLFASCGMVFAERVIDPLERFELEELVLLELHGDGPDGRAVFRTPIGKTHEVGLGNFVGADFGQVVAVGRDGLRLKELCQDRDGDWHWATAFVTRGEALGSMRITRVRPDCVAHSSTVHRERLP